MNIAHKTTPVATIEISQPDSLVRCGGAWVISGVAYLERRLATMIWPAVEELQFDVAAISEMDTVGAWLVHRTITKLENKGCTVKLLGLHPEHEALLSAMKPVELFQDQISATHRMSWLERLGFATWPHIQQLIWMLAFFGESVMAMIWSIANPSRIRWRPILYNLQYAGFNALPIVGLLAFLMGVVISFQGAGQLQRYGANIFIADLVGLSMLRELAPLMTAIIVAGRSGSAFAAQIGSMKMNEEIDALRTIGIAPMELLVLPKVLALMIALPLLTVFADIMGVLGGMVMAKSQLGVSYLDFLDRFDDAIKLSALMVGIGKAPVFAAIIAIVGCFQGFQVGNRSDSVGRQTTISVVQGIFLIIVADALFSVVFSWLKI
jgi:phospholipid/cholesterol/gamma-HCH transport system permease protein